VQSGGGGFDGKKIELVVVGFVSGGDIVRNQERVSSFPFLGLLLLLMVMMVAVAVLGFFGVL
jgi:hypothetical protein